MATWHDAKAAARYAASDRFDQAWIDDKRTRILANCHPKQRAFVLDPHRRVSALVGRRGGKTTGQRARFVIKMITIANARCVYVATTRQAAEELMWAPLKDLLSRLGIAATFNETKLRCTFSRNGSQLRLFGAEDKKEIEKLRGNKYHEVGIDEAASYPPALLDNLIDRIIGPALGDFRGVLSMFGTPGHDLRGPFYDATRPGSELHRVHTDLGEGWTSWSSHSWTLQDGAEYVPEMRNAWDEALVMKRDRQWEDTNPIWMREWLGQWSSDDQESVFKYRPHLDGEAWNQWDPDRTGPLGFARLPDGDWRYVIGMDLGHHDPFALVVFAYSPSDPTRTIYHVYEFIQTRMYARTIAEKLLGPERNHENPGGVIGITGWPDGMVADLAGLGDSLLDELQAVYGIRVVGAEKGAKYKHPAIELFNGDLIDGRIKILKGSQLETELSQLQWREDEFGRVSEDKRQSNHASDAAIYARRVIAKLFEAGNVPSSPARAVFSRGEPVEPDDSRPAEFEGLLSDANPDLLLDPWGDDE